MSGGSDNVTQTTEPPAFARPFLQSGLQRADQMFRQGGPQQFQGDTVVPFSDQTNSALNMLTNVVPFSDQTNSALNMLTNRAQQGSPVDAAAQQNITETLSGSLFDDPNSRLFQQFDNAADRTRTRLSSEFAGSGRDLSAALPARSEELQTLMSNIFGQERNRQIQAAGMSPAISGTDFRDISALANAGGTIEGQAGAIQQDRLNRFNFEQQRPEQNLNQFLSRIGAGAPLLGQSVTSPVSGGSPILGGLGGAGLGASLGSALALSNPWTAALAGVGGLAGLLG